MAKEDEKSRVLSGEDLKRAAEEANNLAKDPEKNKDRIIELEKQIIASTNDKKIKKIAQKVIDKLNPKEDEKSSNDSVKESLKLFMSRIISEEDEDIQSLTQDVVDALNNANFGDDDKSILGIKGDDLIQVLKVIDSISENIKSLNSSTVSTVVNIYKAIDSKGDSKKGILSIAEVSSGLNQALKSHNIPDKDLALISCLISLKTSYANVFNKDSTIPKAIDSSTAEMANNNDKKLFQKFYIHQNEKDSAKGWVLKKGWEEVDAVFQNFNGYSFDDKFAKCFKTFEQGLRTIKDLKEGKLPEGAKNMREATPKENENEKIKNDAEETLEKTNENLRDLQSDTEKLNEIKAQAEKENDPITNQIIQKRKFYIFDIDKLKADTVSKPEEVEDFLDNLKDAANKLINDIVSKLESYAPKAEHSKDDLKIEESISKRIITKYGFVIKEDYEKSYQKDSGKINKYIEGSKANIDKLIDSYRNSLVKIANAMTAENNYKKMVALQLKFDNAVTDLGYKLTKEVQKATEKSHEKLKYMKLDKEIDDAKKYKSSEQRGQEALDIANIKKIINGAFTKDHQNLAKIMLINLLTKFNDSKDIVDRLNAKKFDNSFFTDGIIYAGSSGSIYAIDPDKITEKEAKGCKYYIFDQTRARIYKNPKDLLNSVGINVNSLTVDVMKEVKKSLLNDANNNKKTADEYINSAQKMFNYVKNISGSASIVTEGIGDVLGKIRDKTSDTVNNIKGKIKDGIDKQKEDFHTTDVKQDDNANDFVGNQQIQQTVKNDNNNIDRNYNNLDELLSANTKKIEKIENHFEPKGTGVDDIVFRQFFKGFVLFKTEQANYIARTENLKTLEQMIENIGKPTESQSKAAQEATAAGMNDGSEVDWGNGGNGNTSVVTSDAADSTYGDGYNSKRLKEMKKKLNSTTYTYSPNSKTKIVRRTFD